MPSRRKLWRRTEVSQSVNGHKEVRWRLTSCWSRGSEGASRESEVASEQETRKSGLNDGQEVQEREAFSEPFLVVLGVEVGKKLLRNDLEEGNTSSTSCVDCRSLCCLSADLGNPRRRPD